MIHSVATRAVEPHTSCRLSIASCSTQSTRGETESVRWRISTRQHLVARRAAETAEKRFTITREEQHIKKGTGGNVATCRVVIEWHHVVDGISSLVSSRDCMSGRGCSVTQ